MSSSSTYIYTYLVFAVVYLTSSITFVLNAVRISTGLSRTRDVEVARKPHVGETTADVRDLISHSQRLVDYTQLAILLPLVYVAGSVFLGSLIVGGTSHGPVNVGWLAFTAAATAAAIVFVVLGMRESAQLGHLEGLADASGRAADALQRIGVRLGVSAGLLLLVAVFMTLNLYSVLSGIRGLLGVRFLI